MTIALTPLIQLITYLKYEAPRDALIDRLLGLSAKLIELKQVIELKQAASALKKLH
jgi:hypothetical protein